MASTQLPTCSYVPNQETDQTKVCDIEKQSDPISPDEPGKKQSMFSSLGLLDRFLAVWIFLAMAIGIILGNFVPSTGPALQRGKFVGVSVPIGKIRRTKFNLFHIY
jgi:ACR3 family arsenite transporter